MNRIEKINTYSESRVKNSNISRIIFITKFILVIQFELILIFVRFYILLNIFKSYFNFNINNYNLVESYRIQIYLKKS